MGPKVMNSYGNFNGMNQKTLNRKRMITRDQNVARNRIKRQQLEAQGGPRKNLTFRERQEAQRVHLAQDRSMSLAPFDIQAYGNRRAFSARQISSRPDTLSTQNGRIIPSSCDDNINLNSPHSLLSESDSVSPPLHHKYRPPDNEASKSEEEMTPDREDAIFSTDGNHQDVGNTIITSEPNSSQMLVPSSDLRITKPVSPTTLHLPSSMDDLLNLLLLSSSTNPSDGPSNESELTIVPSSENKKEFRPGQREAIQKVMEMERGSVIYLAPTGTGKSLVIHAVASLLKYSDPTKKMISLVVLPTLGLVKDFIAKLPATIRGCEYTGSVPWLHRKEMIGLLTHGFIDLLAITPEQLATSLKYELRPLAVMGRIGLLALDEAHCLSSWGHAFRPAYLQTLSIATHLLKIPRILALTATASESCKRDLKASLEKVNPPAHIYAAKVPIQRNNLTLNVHASVAFLSETDGTQPHNIEEIAVRYSTDSDLAGCDQVVSTLASPVWRRVKCIIVYTWKRHVSEQLSRYLSTKLSTPRLVACYHSGLVTEERAKIQQDFIDGKYRIIVATMALGIGIHQDVVDGVIHYNMPKSIEQYVQETGRCARKEGKTGLCQLFLRDLDYREMYQQEAANLVDVHAMKAFLILMRTNLEADEAVSVVKECTGPKDIILNRVFETNPGPTKGMEGRHCSGKMRWVLFSKQEVAHRLLALRSYDDLEVLLTLFNIQVRKHLPDHLWSTLESLDENAPSERTAMIEQMLENLSLPLARSSDVLEVSEQVACLPLMATFTNSRQLKLRAFKTSFVDMAEINDAMRLLMDGSKLINAVLTVEIFDILKKYPDQFSTPIDVDFFAAKACHELAIAMERPSNGHTKLGSVSFSVYMPDACPDIFIPLFEKVFVSCVASMRARTFESIARLNETYSTFRRGALYGEETMRTSIDAYMANENTDITNENTSSITTSTITSSPIEPYSDAWRSVELRPVEYTLFREYVRGLSLKIANANAIHDKMRGNEGIGGQRIGVGPVLGASETSFHLSAESEAYTAPSVIARVLCGCSAGPYNAKHSIVREFWGVCRRFPYLSVLQSIYDLLEVGLKDERFVNSANGSPLDAMWFNHEGEEEISSRRCCGTPHF